MNANCGFTFFLIYETWILSTFHSLLCLLHIWVSVFVNMYRERERKGKKFTGRERANNWGLWCFAACAHHNNRCSLGAKNAFLHHSTDIIQLSSCSFIPKFNEVWMDGQKVCALKGQWEKSFTLLRALHLNSYLFSWWTYTTCAAAVLVILVQACSLLKEHKRQWNRHMYAKIAGEMILFWHWLNSGIEEAVPSVLYICLCWRFRSIEGFLCCCCWLL